MNLAIWGYCERGIKCAGIIEKYLKNDKVVCYIDNNFDKINLNDKIPVISVYTLKQKIDKKEIDKIIFPELLNLTLNSIYKQLYNIGIDYFDLIYYTSINIFEKNARSLGEFEKLIEKEKEILPSIASMEIEIVKQCNLKCRRCSHFSNLFDCEQYADINVFKKDIKELHKKTEDIVEIKLLGGEPFLNENLAEFIYAVKAEFPNANVIILSNALIIKNVCEETLNVIRQTNSKIIITLYPVMKYKIDDVITYLKEKEIRHSVGYLADEFGKIFSEKPINSPMQSMHECISSTCHGMENGKIFKCILQANIGVFNKKFNKELPYDYVDLYDESMNSEKLKKYFLNPCSLCNYCGKPVYYKWERSGDNVKAEDWLKD